MAFKKATKKETKAKVALDGVTGAGKTFTALRVATAFAKKLGDKPPALVDSERKSASKYVGEVNPDGGYLEFDVNELDSHSPDHYVQAIREAENEGYGVLAIDSLSHAWMGKDGALEQVDRRAAGAKSSFNAWREVTPMHQRLVDAILNSPMHIIVTMRSKTEYVIEQNDKGQSVPRKVGMAPVMRDGIEYEFDVVGDMDVNHTMTITKTRCSALDGRFFHKPGADLANLILRWLTDGAVPLSEALALEDKELRAKCEALADEIATHPIEPDWRSVKYPKLIADNGKTLQGLKACFAGLTTKLNNLKAAASAVTAKAAEKAAETVAATAAGADAGALAAAEAALAKVAEK